MKILHSQHGRLEEAFADRRVCVTGGAGFIGGHLAETLLSLGGDVTVIDDLSTGDAEFIASLIDRFPGRARFVYASILDPDAVVEATDGCDVVFHLAAQGSVPLSINDPKRAFAVNATGALRMLEAARFAGASRFVFASSSSVYGDSAELPKIESMPLNPLSPYAASKASAELLVRAWAKSYDLSGVSLRFFNVFGERQPASGAYAAVIPAFVNKLSVGERPTIYGDGSQTRDFTHVDNAVLAMLLAGSADRPFAGQTINVGCGQRTSLNELLDVLRDILERPELTADLAPGRTGDVPHSVADLSGAAALLEYEPMVGLREGLKRTASWMLSRDAGIRWADS